MKARIAGPHLVDVVCGIAGAAGWFILFGFGLLVDSKPFRDAVAASFDWHAFFMSLIAYTPTNIAFLALLAAFTGGCASRLVQRNAVALLAKSGSAHDAEPTDSGIYMQENPVSSMLRGFAVYLAFLAGVYVISNAPFAAPTPEQYARAAGAVSFFAFVLGYDPTTFRQFISLGSKLKKS